MDKGQIMKDLKECMSKVEPLPDEPHFAITDETIVRFLKCSDWKIKDAEKALLNTIEFRRHNRPLRSDCKWCHERPGYHSMRQVGHDECGRPVIYANFAQASTRKNTVDDIVAHVTYLIENAKATMEVGVTTWVFVIDCTGMTMSACNPKLGYGMASILSNHYPERLGLVICVNHNPMFHGVWKALKRVVSAGTASKVRLVRSAGKIQQVFSTYFSEELTAWLTKEIELNKIKPLSKSQREFWAAPSTSESQVHDPRGTPSYVRDHIIPFYHRRKLEITEKNGTPSRTKSSAPSSSAAGSSKQATTSMIAAATGITVKADDHHYGGAIVPRYTPHPNIADALFGNIKSISESSEKLDSTETLATEEMAQKEFNSHPLESIDDLSDLPENMFVLKKLPRPKNINADGTIDDNDDDMFNISSDDDDQCAILKP